MWSERAQEFGSRPRRLTVAHGESSAGGAPGPSCRPPVAQALAGGLLSAAGILIGKSVQAALGDEGGKPWIVCDGLVPMALTRMPNPLRDLLRCAAKGDAVINSDLACGGRESPLSSVTPHRLGYKQRRQQHLTSPPLTDPLLEPLKNVVSSTHLLVALEATQQRADTPQTNS